MANFNDIIGWEEELEELRQTEDYRRRWKVRGDAPKPPVPLSNALEFVELILKNDDLLEGARVLRKWAEDHSEASPGDYPDTYPWETLRWLRDFEFWYCLKSGCGPNDFAFRIIKPFVFRVLEKHVPALRSPETTDYFRKYGGRHIDLLN